MPWDGRSPKCFTARATWSTFWRTSPYSKAKASTYAFDACTTNRMSLMSDYDTIASEDLLVIFFFWIMQRECFAPNALISQSLAHAVARTEACSQNDIVSAKCYRACPRQSTRRSGCSNMHATATHSSCMRHSEQCMQHDESINTLGQSKGT